MERRPDSFWSCLVCAASVLSILIATSGPYAFGLLLPPLMDEFSATRQETGKWNCVSFSGCRYISTTTDAFKETLRLRNDRWFLAKN